MSEGDERRTSAIDAPRREGPPLGVGALSSACIFFHGLGLFTVGSYYVAQPSESLEIIADAWGVRLSGTKASADAYVLARNLVMVAAVYLAVWGLTCMTLATQALPRTKRMIACLNLLAALFVAICSSFHPEAVASSKCLESTDAGVECFKVAGTWHLPFIILDVLGIIFAEAGPSLMRVNENTSILLNGQISEEARNTTITKINSHADLIKYADSAVADAHAGTVAKAGAEDCEEYADFMHKKSN